METNSSVNVNITDINEYKNAHNIPDWTIIVGVILMLIVTLVGLLGNGIILLVQWRIRDKSSTDYLVSAMAAFELYCSGFNSTVVVLSSFGTIWKLILSVPLCCFKTYSNYLTSISTTFLLTAIALDRYIQTYRPLNTFYTKTKAKRICVAIVITSILLAVPSIGIETTDKYNFKCERRSDTLLLSSILDLLFTAAFVIMFVIVVICYAKVTILLHRRHRQKALSRLTTASLTTNSRLTFEPSSSRSRIHQDVRFHNNKVFPMKTQENVMDVHLDSTEGCENSILQKQIATEIDNRITTNTNNVQLANQQKAERKVLHRTTLIMFLITIIYIVTWFVHSLAFWILSPYTLDGRTALYLTTNLYMINCMTNPVFYIAMSSKFRQNAKQWLCRR